MRKFKSPGGGDWTESANDSFCVWQTPKGARFIGVYRVRESLVEMVSFN